MTKHIRTRLLALLMSVVMLFILLPASTAGAAETKPVGRSADISSVTIPAYSGGTTSGWMIYDGGLGMALGKTGDQSKMRIVTGTTTAQYSAYLTTLKNAGYIKLFGRAVAAQSGSNRHDKHLSPDGTFALYTYWTPATKEVRMIVDTHVDTLRTFSYTSEGSGNGRTEVYMCSLQFATDGHRETSNANTEYRSNSGSLFVIKMPDNSLFVVDGGDFHQMGDRACEQLYTFLRSITNTEEDEKIIINTWFISHNHFDHVSGFPRFLHKYNTKFDLLNIMYNFDAEGSSQKYIRRVAQLYPNAKYYKQHTGESFKIAGVQFDVLLTVEDRYVPNSSNKLILEDVSCLGIYEDSNDCSSVLRMSFDGKEMILTGDMNKMEARLISMYPAADLKADLLQIPHHGFDEHSALVKAVSPSISFVNQAKSATMNRKDTYDNNVAWAPYAGTIYHCGDHTVGYAADVGVFYDEQMDSVDYYDWKQKTYYIEESNYYDGSSEAIANPEQYYRYTRVNALSKEATAYAIVDDKVGRVLSYDAVSGAIGNENSVYKSGDVYYFGASQRRKVNWLISCSNSGVKSGQAVSGATTYYGTVPIYKGTGDYWGSPTKARYIAIANGDTFESKGMYSSWTSISNMLETASKDLWIDLLPGDYFLIYRYTGGSYYPLYRDGNGNVTTINAGWGAAKLTQAKISAQADFLRHRLYAYHETSDTMYLYWTGHKDYTTNLGTPQNDILSMIMADIRVMYRLESFGATGEITYDGWKKQTPGTYWLEFADAYASNTPGAYTVYIRYKNAAGTILTLGELTVYVRDSSVDPEAKSLLFDFDDDTEAREKYKYRAQYAELNFDAATRWEFLEYNYGSKANIQTEGVVDTDAGVLQIYSATNDTSNRNLSFRTYALDTTPLKYDPADAEVIQVRFKMDNLKTYPGKNSYFRLWYYKNNGSEDVYTYEKDYYFGKDYVADGEYMTITVNLFTEEEIAALTGGSQIPTQTFSSCDAITGLRPGFHQLTPIDPTKESSITVDYLYIGPAEHRPIQPHTVSFYNEDGTLLEQKTLMTGETAAYTGPVPTKAYDKDYHYTFVGWNGALENVTEDRVLMAKYAAIAHNYIDNVCSCGAKEIVEPIYDDAVKFSHSLTLENDISINFIGLGSALIGYDSFYLECKVPVYNGNELVGYETVTIEPVYNGKNYECTLLGITAKMMNDEIEAVFHMTKDGQEYYSKTDVYSVAEYAYGKLDSTKTTDTAELKAICANLLRYGSMAQTQFGYRTDALVDTAMTDAHKAFLTDLSTVEMKDYRKQLSDLDTVIVPWKSTTLELGNKVIMCLIANLANYSGDPSELTMRLSYTDAKGVTVTEERPLALYNPEALTYAVSYDGLRATEMRSVVSAAIYRNGERVSKTVEYSIESYGARSKDPAMQELCRAMLAYGDAANAFFAN